MNKNEDLKLEDLDNAVRYQKPPTIPTKRTNIMNGTGSTAGFALPTQGTGRH